MSKLVKNSALYLISTIVLKATSYLLLPLYSNLVSPDAYGKVYLVSSYVTFFGIFMCLSMGSSVQRFYFNCKSEREVKELYSTNVIFVFLVATLLAGLLVLFNNTIAGWMKLPPIYLLMATAAVYMSTFYNLISSLLYAKQKAITISVASIVLGVLNIVTQLVLVLSMTDKAMALILAILIGGIMHMLLFLWFSRKYFIFKFNVSIVKPSIVFGLSQLPSDISLFIVSLSDRFILNKYKDSASVGIYGMGHTLGSIPNILFHAMAQALTPIVFTNYTDYKEGRVTSISYACSLIERIAIILTMIITIIIVFSNNIVAILSTNYQKSGLIMYMVLFAVLIDIYRKLFVYPITYDVKYVKIKSSIWVLASVLSITLNLLLIPRFSYYGACISLISVNLFTLFLILIESNKAMHPVYQTGKLISIFAISIICSFLFFLGFSWKMIPVKLLLVLIYLIVINKIYPIDYKSIISILRIKKKRIK